ncbi:LPS assembly lipoprotein LptE [Hydrogenimonas sp.]|uniref:LPS assembly lipoprotein LptE n=1 Tax=Hydrogenimonas sp. TaxID=2231112 RepID=UPI00261E910A|nr:LPS assembly lipoprotein LptE [Hydrogenimonas sp.]
MRKWKGGIVLRWMRYLLLSLFALHSSLFTLAGCGYKPTTAYTQKVLSGKIYTDVEVYLRDPENAVLVKDALNEAIVSRFGANIADKDDATTVLHVKFNNVDFTPIQYDTNGYAIYYRAKVSLEIRYDSPVDSGTETVSGFYDFPIQPRAIISDALRFQAIKKGSGKALDAFVSRITLRGVKL